MLSNAEIYTAYIEAANQTLRPQDERIALAFARAIEAAVLAKLQAQSEPVAWRYHSVSPFKDKDGMHKVSDKWKLIDKPNQRDAHSAMCGMEAEPLYTHPAPVQVGINRLTQEQTDASASVMGLTAPVQQEPVAWMTPMGNVFAKHQLTEAQKADLHPLYTHPAPVQQEADLAKLKPGGMILKSDMGGVTFKWKYELEIERLEAQNKQLLEALNDIAYGLEGARIWGGMDWTYNPLHPYKYLPLRDKARAAIAAVEGKHG